MGLSLGEFVVAGMFRGVGLWSAGFVIRWGFHGVGLSHGKLSWGGRVLGYFCRMVFCLGGFVMGGFVMGYFCRIVIGRGVGLSLGGYVVVRVCRCTQCTYYLCGFTA